MLAYISQFFSLVYFSPVGLFIVSYISFCFVFVVFFCNKFEIWWLYQSSTVSVALSNFKVSHVLNLEDDDTEQDLCYVIDNINEISPTSY